MHSFLSIAHVDSLTFVNIAAQCDRANKCMTLAIINMISLSFNKSVEGVLYSSDIPRVVKIYNDADYFTVAQR